MKNYVIGFGDWKIPVRADNFSETDVFIYFYKDGELIAVFKNWDYVVETADVLHP